MNERIKELAEQAQKEVWGNNPYNGSPEFEGYELDAEKFAELIVAECMTTILKESKWYWDKDEFESANAIQNAARRVKEHFGVEE
jgi:hypothetical protein